MQASADAAPGSFQARFHARWNHLLDPHVRTLAWLLDSPDLLDPEAAQWQGRIASIDRVDETTQAWLADLDRAPGRLHDYLGLQPFTRLGRYSEKLMAFYLEHTGVLYAHGVQVHASNNETVGEFDFLLSRNGQLLHWEFATKLYLLEAAGSGHHADYFVGPNLADTLGAKVRKIMDRQLSLSQHPAAQALLPQPVSAAQALVKGWLFYHGSAPAPVHPQGVFAPHCRGFWCALNELESVPGQHFIVLPRLSWLTPAKTLGADALDRAGLEAALVQHFETSRTPALVASLQSRDGYLLEADRGFIVPDDWRARAGLRVRHTG